MINWQTCQFLSTLILIAFYDQQDITGKIYFLVCFVYTKICLLKQITVTKIAKQSIKKVHNKKC